MPEVTGVSFQRAPSDRRNRARSRVQSRCACQARAERQKGSRQASAAELRSAARNQTPALAAVGDGGAIDFVRIPQEEFGLKRLQHQVSNRMQKEHQTGRLDVVVEAAQTERAGVDPDALAQSCVWFGEKAGKSNLPNLTKTETHFELRCHGMFISVDADVVIVKQSRNFQTESDQPSSRIVVARSCSV